MRKRRQIRRRRVRFFMVLCCIVCFLCGFTFRGSIRTAYADSDSPKASAISPEVQSSDTSNATKKYYMSVVVEAGDSLYSIAKKYYSEDYESIEKYILEIKKVNRIRSDYICQGSYLTIPYYGEI